MKHNDSERLRIATARHFNRGGITYDEARAMALNELGLKLDVDEVEPRRPSRAPEPLHKSKGAR